MDNRPRFIDEEISVIVYLYGCGALTIQYSLMKGILLLQRVADRSRELRRTYRSHSSG